NFELQTSNSEVFFKPLMKPPKSLFSCQTCGGQSPKWLGRCPECGAWNSLVEERETPARDLADQRHALPATAARSQLYSEVDTVAAERISTGISELDRVLGGGLAPGSLVLLGGEPGIGKSTLLLQAAAGLVRASGGTAGVLYATGEESPGQVRLRAARLGLVTG